LGIPVEPSFLGSNRTWGYRSAVPWLWRPCHSSKNKSEGTFKSTSFGARVCWSHCLSSWLSSLGEQLTGGASGSGSFVKPQGADMVLEEEFEGAIATLDLMGFIHRAKDMSPGEALDSLIGPLVAAAYTAQKIVNRDLRHHFELFNQSKEISNFSSGIGVQVFADTIILYLPHTNTPPLTSPDMVINSMVYSCSLVLAYSIWLNVPVRGAIAYGKFLICNRPPIALGEPFLEAHELQESQQWAGVSLCKSAELLVQNSNNVSRLKSWPVELCIKESQTYPNKNLLVVDWPRNSWNHIGTLISDGVAESAPSIDWSKCFPGDSEKIYRLRRNTEAFYLDHIQNAERVLGVEFGPFTKNSTLNWRTCINESIHRPNP